jgi:putative flippase GtrA
LSLKYGLFALAAMASNLCLQAVTHRFYKGDFELFVSMALGTLAGLVVKYLLDKRFIFHYRTAGVEEEGKKFSLYTATGVLTTLVFWGCEIAFDWLFGKASMRYLGALIGLTIGYSAKYQLDKRFVFRRCHAETSRRSES